MEQHRDLSCYYEVVYQNSSRPIIIIYIIIYLYLDTLGDIAT